jgi:hypothetical protein
MKTAIAAVITLGFCAIGTNPAEACWRGRCNSRCCSVPCCYQCPNVCEEPCYGNGRGGFGRPLTREEQQDQDIQQLKNDVQDLKDQLPGGAQRLRRPQ